MERRRFAQTAGVVGLTALAGCSGGSTESSGTSEGASTDESTDTDATDESTEQPTPVEPISHSIGEAFTVGDGAQSIQYTVSEFSVIDDYVGDPDFGATPDGTFVVVILEMENVGDESLDISSRILKLADDGERQFDADTEAGIYADQDSRISADGISFDQLQPGLSVTRSVIFDVPPGTYRFVAEPAGIFSNADPHYVPLGDV